MINKSESNEIIDLIEYDYFQQGSLDDCEKLGIDKYILSDPNLTWFQISSYYNQAIFNIDPKEFGNTEVDCWGNISNQGHKLDDINREIYIDDELYDQLIKQTLITAMLMHDVYIETYHDLWVARYNKIYNTNLKDKEELETILGQYIIDNNIKVPDYLDYKQTTLFLLLHTLGIEPILLDKWRDTNYINHDILETYLYFDDKQISQFLNKYKEELLDTSSKGVEAVINSIYGEFLHRGKLDVLLDERYSLEDKVFIIDKYKDTGVDMRLTDDIYRELTPNEMRELRELSNRFRRDESLILERYV